MLKIKDNVDLKELEKYGYSIDLHLNQASKKINLGFDKYGDLHSILILIKDNIIRFKHEINFYVGYSSNFIEFGFFNRRKYLKDLIKADLVEKVD